MNVITPRGIEINADAARPIDAIRVARHLLHTTRVASIATTDPGGYPYSTVTNLTIEPTGTPVMFMARLTLHARNIEADPRVSVTMANHQTDVMTTPRLTVSGLAERVEAGDVEAVKARYLERFPKSKLYLALPDALLYRVRVQAVQLNGGPAQNANAVTADDLLLDLAPSGDLMAAAPALIGALNSRGGAVTLAKLAGGKASGRWRVSAIDPEGIDLTAPDDLARLWLPQRVDTQAAFEAALAAVLA